MESPSQFTQVSKTVHDLQECIIELKRDYEDNHEAITDDAQTLHRFCAKIEFLLQSGLKPELLDIEVDTKTGLLGGRKDYWDYMCSCLAGNKGLSDGVRFVKSISELKTSLGRGRALIRFALMHHRLADTIQQCAYNAKITSDWYTPAAVWLNPKLTSDLINSLYDLNDIQFDLSPRGYDLDAAWPQFARKQFGTGSRGWTPPSRSTSISSLASSLQPESLIVQAAASSPGTSEVSEIDRLKQELNESENERIRIQMRLEATEHERDSIITKAAELEQKVNSLQSQNVSTDITAEKTATELQVKEAAWLEKETYLTDRIAACEALVTEMMEEKSAMEKAALDRAQAEKQVTSSDSVVVVPSSNTGAGEANSSVEGADDSKVVKGVNTTENDISNAQVNVQNVTGGDMGQVSIPALEHSAHVPSVAPDVPLTVQLDTADNLETMTSMPPLPVNIETLCAGVPDQVTHISEIGADDKLHLNKAQMENMDQTEARVRLVIMERLNMALKMELKSLDLRVRSLTMVNTGKDELIAALETKLASMTNKCVQRGKWVESLEDKCIRINDLRIRSINQRSQGMDKIKELTTKINEYEKRNNDLKLMNAELKKMLNCIEDKSKKIAVMAKEKCLKFIGENNQLKAKLQSLGEPLPEGCGPAILTMNPAPKQQLDAGKLPEAKTNTCDPPKPVTASPETDPNVPSTPEADTKMSNAPTTNTELTNTPETESVEK